VSGRWSRLLRPSHRGRNAGRDPAGVPSTGLARLVHDVKDEPSIEQSYRHVSTRKDMAHCGTYNSYCPVDKHTDNRAMARRGGGPTSEVWTRSSFMLDVDLGLVCLWRKCLHLV
jgi:hypothetical protein